MAITHTGKLNLAKLEHVIKPISSKEGGKIDCLIIPIEKNKLYKSEKGNVFLDLAVFEIDPAKRKGDDTHLVVQSLSKEDREAGKQGAILGNLRDFGAPAADTPNVSDDLQPSEDDLPF